MCDIWSYAKLGTGVFDRTPVTFSSVRKCLGNFLRVSFSRKSLYMTKTRVLYLRDSMAKTRESSLHSN